jgi:phosphate-selective porin OprO and OprP
MNLKRTVFVVTLTGVLTAGQRVWADDTADEIKALREQIQALDQKVRILERQRELDTEVTETKSKDVPRIVAGASGLSVSTADTNFVFQLRGLLQVDNRTFFRDGGIQGNDGFLLRRARPIFQGTLFRDFDFLFVPDFGGSSVQIFDAYLNYRYAPWLQLRAGKFKPPVGLEQLQSDPCTSFNERALPTALIPGRDIGFQLWGDIADGRLSYAVGVFNGVGDARNSSNADFEDHREVAARLFVQPFKKSDTTALKGLGFGIGGTWGNVSSNATGLSATTGGTLSGYVTDGQQQFFAYNPTNGNVAANGTHWRLSPQAYYYWGPFGLLGEYVISHQRVTKGAASADLQHTAWQISAGWVLTGEDASYNGVIPRKNFDPRAGTWGAFQLVGRYAQLDIDDDTFPVYANPLASASEAQAWSVGLNWYLNRNLRLNTSFSRTTFDGGGNATGGAATTAPNIVARQPEEVVFTRVQLAF